MAVDKTVRLSSPNFRYFTAPAFAECHFIEVYKVVMLVAGPIVPFYQEEVAEELRRWRFRQFRKLGFSRLNAHLLAEGQTDAHEMEQLLEAGCSHDLATKILT